METRETVVGLTGSASSAGALRWAVEQCELTGSPLRVVHTWELPPGEGLSAAPLRDAAAATARLRAERLVAQAIGPARAEQVWLLDVVEGPAGPVLVERSRKAAMLVVGTRHHAGLRRLVAGSVSHYCISQAACPVVAVPLPEGLRMPAPRHREPAMARVPQP